MIHNIEPENQNMEQDDQAQKRLASEESQSDNESNESNKKPLTTQGTQEEIEENLGGTTNLSLDQLKKEGDAGH